MAAYKKVVCPVCNGTGLVGNMHTSRCSRCGGTGEILRDIEDIEREEAFLLGRKLRWYKASEANNQEAKADAGKPRLSLVPTQIFYDIARVREYGDKKYGSTDNWKTVEAQRYVDAMFRHLLAFVTDPDGRDDESGLPHLWHLECNAAFLSEMMKGRWQ